MGDLHPAYQRVVGRKGGAANEEAITGKVRGILHTERKTKEDQMAEPRCEQGPDTSLLLVQEVGGIPLNYYSRLREVLKKAYFDKEVEQQRPTCHIKYRETFEDLPEIELLEAAEIAEIREHVYDVLRAFILRIITAGNDGVFQVYVAHPEVGGYWVRLGTRISRIIRNACARQDIRNYLRYRWRTWRDRATPTQKAVLYYAIWATLQKFPERNQTSEMTRPRPIFNCYRNLATDTRNELRDTPEGREWCNLLYWAGDKSDPGYAAWQEQSDAIAREITEKCLVEASKSLPLYQINEARIGEIRRPGS